MTHAKQGAALSGLAKLTLVALLAAPALFSHSSGSDGAENRRMAPPPQRPASVEEALKYSASFDAWARDNFSLREALVRLNTRVRYHLFGVYPTNQVIQGREGRSFLTTSHPLVPPYDDVFSSCGYQRELTGMLNQQIGRLLTLSRERGIQAKLLVVPSSPVVHVDQLPAWTSALCHTATPPMARWLAQPGLDPALRRDVAYPLEQMRAAARETDLFPRTFFHWGGAGPRLVAEWSLGQFYGARPEQATPYTSGKQWLPSDVSHLFPGLERRSEVEVMDLDASGIAACHGAACFPGGPAVLEKFELALYRNPKAARGRLLLITDSFGPPAAPWFARYYRETVLFNVNTLYLLEGPRQERDLERVRRFLFDGREGDDVVVMYHDATVHAKRIALDFPKLLPGF
ncbi:hypothetical protein [Pseudoduganella namucuonensis]|uniref:AlgX/AlgJ SGNH hydrolase-like domain-containing protein n=1 Tax=Pseudoduganella namucuonensis TaxID=1035707 RepID=A0A1I7JU30_9BURK|nr:hypothetical protein [Pseudoduganella namucuonensis]SFU88665.1 hypothetical protein SAMN05216552_10137 [Pseudoduganella namucuonensis]